MLGIVFISRPPRALDIFASKVNKECLDDASDDDSCVVARKSAAFNLEEVSSLPYGKEIGVRRLCDANRERRSMASLVATEFNAHYRMLLTASVDSTMAFFKVFKRKL
ncbi:unnamed protein product [Trichobilharzia regenti]|nr:unnamed protein product [Trichobilharzia regenti]